MCVCAYAWLAGLVLLLAAAGSRSGEPKVVDDPVYLQAQRLVEIHPQIRLNLYCTGRGSPTVIFDSGLGDSTKAWALVQPVVAAETRACSYDRAGLGFSDPSPKPRTSANIVDDLHLLLKHAHIKPPYVLVGHSLGGMNMRLYAETYLPEVAGIVFVDATHEDQGKVLWELDPEQQKKFAPYLDKLHGCLMTPLADMPPGSDLYQTCVYSPDPHFSDAINAVEPELAKRPGHMAAWISEQENVFFASSDEVRAAHRSFGTIPIIVLTHSPFPRVGDETQTLRDLKNERWIEQHLEMANLSTRGTRRTVENAGHYIQIDQPQAVSSAILEVVRGSR
jgi:pimeloyl-ACP methyl ester carboxylesterase